MKKILGFIFSLFIVFTKVHSANKFTIEDIRIFPSKKEQKQSDLSRAQNSVIANIASEQGISYFFNPETPTSFSKFKNEFINGKQKVSFINKDDSARVSLELDVLDRVSCERIETIMNLVTNYREFVRYSGKRNIDSMFIKIEKNSITVMLSNGNSDEGTIFEIDLEKKEEYYF